MIIDPQEFEQSPPQPPLSSPGWPYRGARPLWAPANGGRTCDEAAAFDRYLATCEGAERRAALMRERLPQPQPTEGNQA
jgi:hypothetical protein